MADAARQSGVAAQRAGMSAIAGGVLQGGLSFADSYNQAGKRAADLLGLGLFK